jgi:hypothetical protein
MFKARLGLPALLASVLALSAATATRAQESKPTQGAQPVGATQGQQQQQQTRPEPLTAGQKIERSFRAAFLKPTPYLRSAFSAGLTQLGEERLPHKDNGDELADWGSRTARSFATRTTSTLFGGGVYPMLFKQDPRYEPSQSKKFGRRMLHSVSRVFVTRDDEGNLEPNYSRFAGSMTASALANMWEHNTPGRDRIGPDATMRRFARSFLDGAITNIVFREFGPDIIGIFRR